MFFIAALVILFVKNVHSQYIHKIKADSVLITNDSCNAELNLENSTKDTLGFLFNKGRENGIQKGTYTAPLMSVVFDLKKRKMNKPKS